MKFYSIMKREIAHYFYAPYFYVLITIFLVLSGYFFYTDTVMFNLMNFRGTTSITRGLWAYYFNDLRFIFILIMPLITMRVFAEEKKLGTIELITTYPLKDIEILTGKVLACLVVFVFMLSLTFINVIIVGIIWDFGEITSVMSGYLCIFFLGFALISCGIFVSSLTDNQIVASLGTMGLFTLFWFLTWNEMIVSEEGIKLLKRLSLFDRTFDFFKGVINSKDVVFFLLFSLYFLFLSLQSLGARSWKGMK